MWAIFDTLPFRAVRGAFGGLEDGLRGRVDTNEKFIDGYRENDPTKKSKAGQFASDYMGVRGGSETGKTVGKWVGGLGSAVFGAHLFLGVAAAGAFAGLWPLIAVGLLTAATAFVGAGVGAFVGKYAGGALGAVGGAITGSAVGLYNGIFRRGSFEKGKEPEVPEPMITPQPDVEALKAQAAAQQQAPQQQAAPAASQAQNLNRAVQQANAVLANGALSREAMAGASQNPPAQAPVSQGFADRVQQSQPTQGGVSRG